MTADPTTSPALHIDTGLQQGPVVAIDMPWPGDCGAENVFLGRTREESHPEFGPLLKLEYEVYQPMAESLLEAMAREAAARFDCRAVRIVHAMGEVPPGLASVVIQVATPHRSESFLAGKYLIDRLKHELPIWKREHWQRGTTYVKGCCAHHPEDRSTTPFEGQPTEPHRHG